MDLENFHNDLNFVDEHFTGSITEFEAEVEKKKLTLVRKIKPDPARRRLKKNSPTRSTMMAQPTRRLQGRPQAQAAW